MSNDSGGDVEVTHEEPSAVGRAVEALWRELDRSRDAFDATELTDVVLVLLYLRGREACTRLNDRSRSVEQALRLDLSPDPEGTEVIRPLIDSLHRVDGAGYLARLIDLVGRLDSKLAFTRVFMAFLDRASLAAGRATSEFNTPNSITDLAAALLDIGPTDRIFDPCCKAGGFPAAICDRLISRGQAVDRLTVGISDYSPRSCALAYLSLRLRGVAPLVSPSPTAQLRSGAPDSSFDVVTANPPFNLSGWTNEHDRIEGMWRYGMPPLHNANFAWLQYVVALLAPGGRAAVVMPNGASFSENRQERAIRAAMVEDGVVSSVVALPGQLFASTGIPVMLWLLQPSRPTPADGVLFVDATGLGEVRRGRRILATSEAERIVKAYDAWRAGQEYAVDGFSTAVPLEVIRADGYRLNPRAYITPNDESFDLRAQAREAGELARQLQQLTQQVVRVDRVLEDRLRELSL